MSNSLLMKYIKHIYYIGFNSYLLRKLTYEDSIHNCHLLTDRVSIFTVYQNYFLLYFSLSNCLRDEGLGC